MNLASYIDHTFLKPNGTPADIAKLCREAKRYAFASVCVHPCAVQRCAKLLKGSGVAVCTVIGFPLGQHTPTTILYEALEAVEHGATELDFVINVSELKALVKRGDVEPLRERWAFILEAVHGLKPGIVTKLIIECCYLTDAEKVAACRMAKAAGFDFVKTSTGFGTGGATVADVKLMRKAVGRKLGVKAAGGIRTKETALAMIAAGATRLGSSAGCEIVGLA